MQNFKLHEYLRLSVSWFAGQGDEAPRRIQDVQGWEQVDVQRWARLHVGLSAEEAAQLALDGDGLLNVTEEDLDKAPKRKQLLKAVQAIRDFAGAFLFGCYSLPPPFPYPTWPQNLHCFS